MIETEIKRNIYYNSFLMQRSKQESKSKEFNYIREH